MPGFQLAEPMDYVDFFGNVERRRVVMRDPGRIQEETTYLGIPCLTMRRTVSNRQRFWSERTSLLARILNGRGRDSRT
jgi:UDP-N-acetylglucosamine 2-epimerase